MPGPLLLSAPNVSEGSEPEAIAAIGAAFTPAALLDIHSDPDHGRSVFTLAAPQGVLADALLNGAREAVARIDVTGHPGIHPHVGAIDVAPVVYLDDERRGPACAEALTAGALIGDELGLPVFLYGELAGGRERADLRQGGVERLARSGLEPDFRPSTIDPHNGAVLVAARPPLIAFNLDLASDDVGLAKEIAAEIRESAPQGMPGVRAIGLHLPDRSCAQVSTNVHDYRRTPLTEVVERVRRRAPVARLELVGLAPRAALEGLEDTRFRTLEDALGSEAPDGPDEEEAPE